MSTGNSNSLRNTTTTTPSSAPKKKMKTEGGGRGNSSTPESSSSSSSIPGRVSSSSRSSETKEEEAETTTSRTVAQAFWERRRKSRPRPSSERTVVPVVVSSTPPDTPSLAGASISAPAVAPAARSLAALPASPSTSVQSNQNISFKSSPPSSTLSSVCPTGTRTTTATATTATTSLPSRSIGERRIPTPQSLRVPTSQQPQTKASPLAFDGNPATEPTGDRTNVATMPACPTPKRLFKTEPTLPGKEADADAYASTTVATEGTDGSSLSSSPATPPLSQMAIENPLNDIDNNDDLHPSLPTTAITPSSVPAIRAGGNACDSTGPGSRIISDVGTWATAPRPGPHRQVPFWGMRRVLGRKRSLTSNSRTNSRVVKTIEISRQNVQQSLPKWISDESGRYPNDEDDSSSLLFTRPQFVERVVLETERLIRGLEWEHRTWSATLSNHHPNDTHSYLLEAEGTDDAMDVLRVTTQTFIREEIGRINLERLLGDGASLVVDVDWVIDLEKDLAYHQILGACLSSIRIDQAHAEGIYIRSVDPKGALAKSLGGREIFSNGCALLAVNKTKVSELSEVEDLMMQAKLESTRTQSKTKIELSLCLSRYADLSEARNVSKSKIHRRDGLPYDEEEHEIFRLHRYIEWTQKQPINHAKVTSEDDEGSASSIEYSTASKKRRSQGKIINKKKAKRRKQIRKEVLSDTDGESDTTDTANATMMDEDYNEKEKNKSKRTTSGYAIFNLFEQKMKPLVILDYKDTRINIKSICSSMWKKHKEIFGEKVRCGDDCKCLMWLPEMVENVIRDHIERPRKKNVAVESEEELEKRTCGIIKNFVPKFIHLLQDEYPTETETQLVKRLVGMWESHQKNRMYGMRCRKGCACQGEWDQIFGKGDKTAAREYLSMMKRSSLMSQSVASSGSQQVTTGPVVPRKKRALPPSKEQSFVKNNRRKKPKLVGLISSMSSRVDIFEVSIASSIPIGGYFKTRKNQCQVFSIYLKGQMAKEPRIQNGTKVLSVKTGGTHIAISSHTELQKFYEDARRTGSSMYISFDKSGAKPNTASDKRMNNIFWNDSGQWIGSANLDENDGWAGGSVNAPKPKPAKKSKQKEQDDKTTANEVYTTKSILNMLNPGADNERRKTSPKNIGNLKTAKRNEDNLTVAEWTTIVNTSTPGHNIRVPKKNLIARKSSFPAEEPGEDRGLSKLMPAMIKKSKRERTHSKRVKFSIPNNEEYFFYKNEASNVRRILQMKLQANVNQMSQQINPEQALTNALHNGSCNDLIHILEAEDFLAAQSAGDFDLEAVLQKEYTLIGNELKKFKDSDQHKRMESQKNDLSAKYRVLSIYISCIHLIERTMSVKKWYALTIFLKYISLQQNHSIVDAIGGNVSLKLHDDNVKEDLSPLPVKSFAQHISYIGENLEYTLHNNKNFLFEKRSFVIDLKKGSLQDSNTGGRTLGSFKLELNNIENICLPDEKPSEFTTELTNHSVQELSSGLVTVNAYKKCASKEYIMLKKQEIIKKLNLQLEYIDRFNQDPKNPPGARLTANIFGRGGKSVLHAAVVLVDDKGLVEKMLTLGANPRSSMNSGIGTPLSLAQRNFHSAVEREKIMRGRGMDVEPHVQRCNQAMMLVEMLQKNIIELPAKSHPRSSFTFPIDKVPTTGISSALNKSHTNRRLDQPLPTSQSEKPPSPIPTKKQKRLNQPIPVIGRLDLTPLPLPTVQKRCWVSLDTSKRAWCRMSATCRFFKQHICHFWHHAPAPLPHEQHSMPTVPPSGKELANLLKPFVKFEKHFAFDNVEWWTAAYVHSSLHTVIYVRKVLSTGYIGGNGVVWFATKAEAHYSLRYTVYLYQFF